MTIQSNDVNLQSEQAVVVEVATFRPTKEVTAEVMRLSAKGLSNVLVKFSGYLDSQLSKNEEGEFLHLVRWANHECAMKAMESFYAIPDTASFRELVDPESVVVKHYAEF